ncbi:MAG TPA: GNAT family N-acetyltransferase [Afifellaceae bacterium]|nr:GNAT family N-acetyltransferase [Afifellaceae bacterium]
MTTRELREDAELDVLTPEWWALWRRLPQTTPFQSPAWLIPWWRSFRPGELRTIAVEADGRLVGLAPLYLESGPLGRRLLPLGVSLSDYLDLLLDPDHAEAAGAAIMAHLVEAEWDWDVLELQELPPGAAALSLVAPPGMEESAGEHSACPVLALPDRLESLREVIPTRQRRKLNLARNRAARAGGVEIREADAATAREHLEALFAVHRAQWQSRGTSGVLDGEAVQRFHRSAVGGLVETGLATLYLLELGGRSVGAFYGFRHNGRVLFYLTGFDPEYERISPGTLLIAHAIEAALAQGAREFHFLRGREPYKYRWGAEDCWNRRRLFRRRAAS